MRTVGEHKRVAQGGRGGCTPSCIAHVPTPRLWPWSTGCFRRAVRVSDKTNRWKLPGEKGEPELQAWLPRLGIKGHAALDPRCKTSAGIKKLEMALQCLPSVGAVFSESGSLGRMLQSLGTELKNAMGCSIKVVAKCTEQVHWNCHGGGYGGLRVITVTWANQNGLFEVKNADGTTAVSTDRVVKIAKLGRGWILNGNPTRDLKCVRRE